MSLSSRPPEFEQLVRDFSIRTPTATSASLILPPRYSRLAFLERAQQAAHAVYHADLIDSDLLDDLRHNPYYMESYDYAVQIATEIQRDGDRKKTQEEHIAYITSNDRDIATEEDTASAWTAFFLKRGLDLFGGEGVQTGQRGLQLNDEGLVAIVFHQTVAVAVAGQPGMSNRQIERN